MSTITHDIVAKLWNLCNVLKDDGVTYHQYVTELTYLLFLKMAKETGTEEQIPAGHRWGDLEAKPAPGRLESYKLTLIHLGTHGSTLVQEIFGNASSFIKKPATLSTLVAEIDKLTHQDLGQMQMYVNYFDRYVKTPEENPTIGILLCQEKKDAIVELTLPRDANIHAKEYQLYLPSKELLRQKLLDWTRDQEAST